MPTETSKPHTTGTSAPPPIAKKALLGAAGGALIGLQSAVLPGFVSPKFHLEPIVAIAVVVGMGCMGAFFGYLSATAHT